MKFNVAQQLKGPVGSVRQYEIEEVTEEGRPVKGEVQLLRTNRSILVTGKLETTVKSVCSRCLEEFDQPLTLEIEEEYFPSRDVVSGLPLPPPSESDAFMIGENHVLDLTEAVRQYTLLALPMKSLCKEDCAGLCPSCGKNLNYGHCDCTRITASSPWAPIQGLLSGKK